MGLSRAERLRRIEPVVTQLIHDAISLELSPADVQELLNKKWKSLEVCSWSAATGCAGGAYRSRDRGYCAVDRVVGVMRVTTIFSRSSRSGMRGAISFFQ